MGKKVELDPALLRELLRYDEATGKLYWKSRPREMFRNERSFGQFNTLFAGKEALTCDNGVGYLTGLVLQKKVKAHRVIWAMVHGYWPEQIDHINHDRKDNRLSNLRDVGQQANALNQGFRKDNTSGRTGVRFSDVHGCWIAHIGFRRVKRHIGCYATFEEACAGREAEERRLGFHDNHGT